jgi:flagellar motor protein MotB
VAGLGAGNPVAPNSTASGRARNRRVEIVLMRSAATNIGDTQGAAQ